MGQENEGSEVWGGEHRVVGVAPSRRGRELGGKGKGEELWGRAVGSIGSVGLGAMGEVNERGP